MKKSAAKKKMIQENFGSARAEDWRREYVCEGSR